MTEARARQAAEGVKLELVLTQEDISLAAKGRHTIDVVLDERYQQDHKNAANRDVVQILLTVESDE